MDTKRECAAGSAMICPAVAVALALQELDRMKAMECLPEPVALLERLHARTGEFDLLVGVCAAYLKAQGVPHE